jgi:hypothetical protein
MRYQKRASCQYYSKIVNATDMNTANSLFSNQGDGFMVSGQMAEFMRLAADPLA